MSSCRILGKFCKRTGEKLPIALNLTEFCERRWQARMIVAVDYVVRPSPEYQYGFEWRCTQAGQTGVVEPFQFGEDGEYPNPAAGDEVEDGAVVWIAQAVSNDSLAKTINDDGVVWSGPAGALFQGANIVNTGGQQLCGVFVNGTIAAGVYRIYALVAFSDTHAENFGVEVRVPA